MEDIEKAIIQITSDLSKPDRWQNPNSPNLIHIKELSEYLHNREQYGAFRKSEVGSYFLTIIEAYEDAFNDDWLPYDIIGLKLNKAKQFIEFVNKEVTLNGLAGSIPNLRRHYTTLANQK
jgi:hypothetical protein